MHSERTGAPDGQKSLSAAAQTNRKLQQAIGVTESVGEKQAQHLQCKCCAIIIATCAVGMNW